MSATMRNAETEMIAVRFPLKLAEQLRLLTERKMRSDFIVTAVRERMEHEQQRRTEQTLDAQAA